MPSQPTAAEFIKRLKSLGSEEESREHQRYFKTGPGDYSEGDIFLGVRMGPLFELVKEFGEMPLIEVEKLLESPLHEARAGGLGIMDKQGRRKKTSDERRKELYDLFMKRIDRINNWDLVDGSCAYVVGRYLFDRPRNVLYKLARSKNVWERRIAIVSTGYFKKHGETEDTYKIAEMLLGDREDLIHKATGWLLRAAGDKDRDKLCTFLTRYATTMPRTALRYSLEHLDKEQRDHYMQLKKTSQPSVRYRQ